VTRHLAVAASAQFPDLREDWPLLRAALSEYDVNAVAVAWTDPSVDWADYDLVLANGAWDYIHRLDEFLAWTDRVGALTRLVNRAPVLRWNADKHYLADLAAAGVPVVPTTFVEARADADPDDSDITLPEEEFVVKPTVSGGAFQSGRYGANEAPARARAHIAHLRAHGRSVMLQPYQHAVDREGETGLIFLDGTFSHAIAKAALLRLDTVPAADSFSSPASIIPASASVAQFEVATAIIEAAQRLVGPITYARVDLVPDEQGTPRLMELEVLEPALFLELHAAAADTFAQVLASTID
jgi:O-ureido-D-serine cyclo-ligase